MMLWIIVMCAHTTGCQAMEAPYVSGRGWLTQGAAYSTRAICEEAITEIHAGKKLRPHVFKDPAGYLDICKAVWLSADDDKWMIGDSEVAAVSAEVSAASRAPKLTYAEKRKLLLQQLAARHAPDLDAEYSKEQQKRINRCRKMSRFNPLTLFGHIDECH